MFASGINRLRSVARGLIPLLATSTRQGAVLMTAPFVPTDPIASLRNALAGRYDIEGEIGQGAFATVYVARDERHDRQVAIKVLNAELSSQLSELRFVREIRLLAKLQHPNILPLHDSGRVETLMYYLMPFVTGETLRARIRRERQLPVDAAVRIASEVCDALAYAHAEGVVHRDIKPENILLSAGHAVVADFGVARVIDIAGRQNLTATGMGGPGTPAYMSPEQLLGDQSVDGRSDVYSLGCVLYEMLVGTPPFAGSDGFAKRFTEDPPRTSQSRKDISPLIDKIIMTALARNPSDRYANAAEFGRALSSVTTRPAAEPNVASAPSIGVLPFANLSGDVENEYFSDGITEEILNALSRIPTLKVAARTSAFALKGKALDIAEIGHRLNVSTVLEGSVRRAGQKVRISVQLINAANGYHIWAERYDRELSDVFEIQEEIARSIVERLKVKLTADQDATLARRHTESLEAYELYLKGRHCWYQFGVPGMAESAIGHYAAALAKDPDYAFAHHGLADIYSVLVLYAVLPPSVGLPKALASATRAVELAPELAETRTSLGIVQLLSWNWAEAEAALLHAIDVNPRYALAHAFYAWLLSVTGRQREASSAARLGQDLEPLSLSTNGVAALMAYVARDYELSIQESRRALERDPTSFLPTMAITMSHAAKGSFAEAVDYAERAVKLSPDLNFLRALLGTVYAMSGQRESATAILNELLARDRNDYVGPTVIAWIYAQLKQPDLAFEWLEKACKSGDCTLALGTRFHIYDELRPDQRFQEVLACLGLR